MKAPRILILLHERDKSFDSTDYLIKFLAAEWEARGCTVDHLRGIRQHRPADLVIPHLDLTVTPRAYARFFRQYSRVVNRGVVDISKSKISANLVRRTDRYTGAVIVKTDRNYGGVPDQWIFPPSRLSPGRWPQYASRLIGRVLGRDAQSRSWRYVESIPPATYPVFPSVRDVPKGVFANRNLIVEKFLPEFAEGLFCLRYYYFFGSAGVSLLFRLKGRGIVRAENAVSVEEVPTPREVEEARGAMGFDYGKFDYVVRDGRAVLFDVNRTPATEALKVWGLRDQIAQRLAAGISSILSVC